MKKFFIIFAFLFLFFFLTFPNTVYAEELYPDIDLGNDVTETILECNSEDSSSCTDLNYWGTYYSSSQTKHDGPYSTPLSFTMRLYPSKFISGANITQFSYIDTISSNDYTRNNFFAYSGKKNNVYRIWLYFSSPSELSHNIEIDSSSYILGLRAKYNDITMDAEDFVEDYTLGIIDYDCSDNFCGVGSSNTYGYALYLEFKSTSDFDSIAFNVSSEDYNSGFFVNESLEKTVYLGYFGFKFVETDKFLLDSDLPQDIQNQIDKIFDTSNSIKEQDSIFDELNSCDSTDFGCHFNNLIILIKGIFNRIGLFFLSILDFLLFLLEKFFQLITDLLKFLFIPNSDDLDSLFNTLKIYFENKLGFLLFPFDFILDFLNRFMSLPNDPISILTVPNISIGSFGTLIKGFSFNISEYWIKAPFKQIYDIYLIFVHAFIGFGLYKLCLKKYNELVGGRSQ